MQAHETNLSKNDENKVEMKRLSNECAPSLEAARANVSPITILSTRLREPSIGASFFTQLLL
jgi:hypothetical protein